jgi:hypothetical protein
MICCRCFFLIVVCLFVCFLFYFFLRYPTLALANNRSEELESSGSQLSQGLSQRSLGGLSQSSRTSFENLSSSQTAVTQSYHEDPLWERRDNRPEDSAWGQRDKSKGQQSWMQTTEPKDLPQFSKVIFVRLLLIEIIFLIRSILNSGNIFCKLKTNSRQNTTLWSRS